MTRIIFDPMRKRPWLVEWQDIWCGERREKAFASEDEAESFERKQKSILLAETALKRGEVGEDPRKDKYSVAELLEAYMATLTRSSSTQAAGRYHLKSLLEMFGPRKASTITRKDAQIYAEVHKVRGLAQGTIAQRLGILRAGLNWAERQGMISQSGLVGMKLSKGESRVYPVPTIDQLSDIMAVAPERVNRVILLGLYTGCRIGPCELFRLKWEHVDINHRTFYIPAALKNRRRNGEFRPIPMRDDLVPALWMWRRKDQQEHPGCEYVIHCQGRPVQSIIDVWRKSLARAGITEYCRPYDLRHAFATMTVEAGQDAANVSKVMGHVNTNMLMRTYLHLSRQIAENTVNAVPGHLGRLIQIPV